MKCLKCLHTFSLAGSLVVIACGDSEPDPTPPSTAPDRFQFESRFVEGESSVAYSGQVKRHLLIATLTDYIGDLDDQTFATTATTGVVKDALVYYYDFSNAGGTADTPITLVTDPPLLQTTWGDLGSLTNLKDKFPEYDADFEGGVIGWGDSTFTPEDVLFDMFEGLETLILARLDGNIPAAPDDTAIEAVYVTQAGLDYRQLIHTFLLGAVPYSQAADDYWDDDIEGKGLRSDNTQAVEGQPYTALEHIWDEGFGYFGGARHYGDFTDDELAGKGGRDAWQIYNDADGDGRIDLTTEHNFGISTSAGQRDRSSAERVPTNFSQDAFDAILAGRHLITATGGTLSETQLAELEDHRDTALGAWEQALAATIVHDINKVLQTLEADNEYRFIDHAKHWSELKGFSLALQFNVRHAAITPAQLQTLHTYIGAAPVLPNAENDALEDHKNNLREARGLLQQIYQFDSANLGDENGRNGW